MMAVDWGLIVLGVVLIGWLVVLVRAEQRRERRRRAWRRKEGE